MRIVHVPSRAIRSTVTLYKTLPAAQLGLTHGVQPLHHVLPPCKGLTMTTPSPTTGTAPPFRHLLFHRIPAGAFIAGAGLAAGVGATAMSAGFHHAAMMDGTHSAAEISAHVDHMLKHFYAEIDATE